MTERRRPWYERFGGIGHESATQSVSKTGIPVPPGGTFQGRPPRGRRNTEAAAAENLEERWSAVSRADRRAEVTEVEWLTRTGTLRLGFEVTDDRPLEFVPGNFLRLERHDPEWGYHRGTYCIASPPSEYRRFDLLVRVVRTDGMSGHLASLRLGDEVAFRGPTGRSMVRAAGPDDQDLVLVATGVGIAPVLRPGHHPPADRVPPPHRRVLGLRLADICLTAQLDRLAERYANFR